VVFEIDFIVVTKLFGDISFAVVTISVEKFELEILLFVFIIEVIVVEAMLVVVEAMLVVVEAMLVVVEAMLVVVEAMLVVVVVESEGIVFERIEEVPNKM